MATAWMSAAGVKKPGSRLAPMQRWPVSSVVFGKEYGGHRTICLGDDPEAVLAFAIGREQPGALADGGIVRHRVFRAQITPVARSVSAQGVQNFFGGKPQAGV